MLERIQFQSFREMPLGQARKKFIDQLMDQSVTVVKLEPGKNGEEYYGQVNAQKKMHGSGVYTYGNGDMYMGGFQNELRHGEGIVFYAGGRDCYVGNFFENLKHGFGKFYYPDGIVEEGNWNMGSKASKMVVKANGAIPIQSDVPMLQGLSRDTPAKKYKGEGKAKDNAPDKLIPHGKGKIIFPQKSTAYQGDFIEGKRQGSGKYYTIDQKEDQSRLIYDGQWHNDKRQGKGIYSYQNGDVYKGQWMNDVKHGSGVMIYNNKQQYDGQWVNNFQHGKGTYTYPDGEFYKGDFVNGKRHGQGIYLHKKGDVTAIYEGSWSNDNMHGKGKVTQYKGGEGKFLFQSEWKEDKLSADLINYHLTKKGEINKDIPKEKIQLSKLSKLSNIPPIH